MTNNENKILNMRTTKYDITYLAIIFNILFTSFSIVPFCLQ